MARARLMCSQVEGEIFVAPPEVVADNLSITQLMAQVKKRSRVDNNPCFIELCRKKEYD